ncbi:MAG: hypothetical protein JO349_05205 [Candidatus Eremiobacteraeota bacterium]|nr:hypothetical protein [Candidatus Eremiobacteraeota bacterium]
MDSVQADAVEPVQTRSPGGIPNFAKDSATLAEYDAAKERAQRTEIADAESAARASYTRKHAAVLAEVAAADVTLKQKREAQEAAVKAYAEEYPEHVRRNQIESPSFFERIFSFGKASRLYNAAARSAEEVLDAQAALRRKQHAEEELETWLSRQLHHAAVELKEQLEQPEWLDKFHARAEVAELWQRVQAIRHEREAYTQRVSAGEVSPIEQRDRHMGENTIEPLRPPFEHVMIESIVHFGDLSCWIFVNVENNKYWLPYDRRLDSLVDWVFDTYFLAGDIEAKFTRSEEGRRAAPLDHYLRHNSDEAEARNEWRKRTSALRTQRDFAKDSPVDDLEDKKTLDLLASLAEANPTTVPGK